MGPGDPRIKTLDDQDAHEAQHKKGDLSWMNFLFHQINPNKGRENRS